MKVSVPINDNSHLALGAMVIGFMIWGHFFSFCEFYKWES